MNSGIKNIILIPALILGVPFAAFTAYKLYQGASPSPLSYYVSPGQSGNSLNSSLPDFTFTDQQNRAISRKDIKDKILIFNFFFTSCSSICPRMMGNVIRLAETYAKDPQVTILSITVDPENDSPEKLKEYGERLNLSVFNWRLLRACKPDIYRFARNGLSVTATEGDGGPEDFIHSDLLVLVDTKGRIRGYYKGTDPKKVEELIRDIKILKEYK
jgi:protein SCO1/2